ASETLVPLSRNSCSLESLVRFAIPRSVIDVPVSSRTCNSVSSRRALSPVSVTRACLSLSTRILLPYLATKVERSASEARRLVKSMTKSPEWPFCTPASLPCKMPSMETIDATTRICSRQIRSVQLPKKQHIAIQMLTVSTSEYQTSESSQLRLHHMLCRRGSV